MRVASILSSAGFALPLLLGAASPRFAVRTESCCAPEFSFSEVKEAANKLLPGLSEPFASILLVPETMRNRLVFAGVSEISASTCVWSAVGLRRSLNHAYLLKTPLGASLHHWDARHSRYQFETLAGRDIYQERLGAGRVAWIGDIRRETPQVWLVSDGALTEAQSSGFAAEAVRVLRLPDAEVYIRTDPYLWRPDACASYTVPMQWQAEAPGGDSGASRVTTHCRIRAGIQQRDCAALRSP